MKRILALVLSVIVLGIVFGGPPHAIRMAWSAPLGTASSCKSVINVAQTATTDVHTMTGYGYICSIVLVSATAQNIGLDEGTGTTCESGGTALIAVSSTSAATAQMAVSANGGFSAVSSTPWLPMQASADHLCVIQSSSGEVAGTITYIDSTQ